MEHIYRKNPGVFVANGPIACISKSDLARIKEDACVAPMRRSRICAHTSADDPVQERIIAMCRDSYIAPHRHVGKTESFHVIEGQADIYFLIFALVFMALDIISGLLKAFKKKAFSSAKMKTGGLEKGALILLLCSVFILDYSQKFIELGVNVPVFKGVSAYIILMEFGSILENTVIIVPTLKDKKFISFFGGVNK